MTIHRDVIPIRFIDLTDADALRDRLRVIVRPGIVVYLAPVISETHDKMCVMFEESDPEFSDLVVLHLTQLARESPDRTIRRRFNTPDAIRSEMHAYLQLWHPDTSHHPPVAIPARGRQLELVLELPGIENTSRNVGEIHQEEFLRIKLNELAVGTLRSATHQTAH